MFSKILVLSCALLALFHLGATKTDKIVCYYESWSAYGDTQPEDFDANLCTHVNYAFIGLKDDGNLLVEDKYLDEDQGLFYRLTDMKKRNPNLKVLLSVGGASASSAQLFSQMAASSSKRGAFVGSAWYFLSTYHFDGLDIDWELPNGGDKANYITLLKQLRTEFDQYGWLVTAAVSSSPGDGYNVGEMNKYLDFINVMTYDMYGSWSEYTGQNSPLYASSVESDWEKQNLNLASCAQNWVNAGADPNKLVMGVAFYGRTFTLADSSKHGLHAPITGVGPGDGGSLNYVEICQSYNSWTRVWDDEQKNPYKYKDNKWIGYDDEDSILIKTDYIKSKNYAGVMIWPIDGDDVHGKCGNKQPLLTKVYNHVNN